MVVRLRERWIAVRGFEMRCLSLLPIFLRLSLSVSLDLGLEIVHVGRLELQIRVLLVSHSLVKGVTLSYGGLSFPVRLDCVIFYLSN